MMGFKHLKGIDSSDNKSEVDKYLAKSCEGVSDEKFDILAWWRVNSPRYHVISKIAWHVLAISIFIVALESTFSMAGHVFDTFQSSLSSTMVEVLICGQNWLRSSLAPFSLRAAMNDVESLKNLIEVCLLYFYSKNIWISISLFIKKKIWMSISFFIKKKKKLNVLNSWHMYCFVLQVTFFVFFIFLFVELVSDITFLSKLDLPTPTSIEVNDWQIFFFLDWWY